MKYNSDIHHRKSIRLKKYDYSQSGAYFITICTKDRELFFENKSIKEIVEKYWVEIPNHFKNVELDEYIIMFNHFHGIIVMNNVVVGADLRVCPNNRGLSFDLQAGKSVQMRMKIPLYPPLIKGD